MNIDVIVLLSGNKLSFTQVITKSCFCKSPNTILGFVYHKVSVLSLNSATVAGKQLGTGHKSVVAPTVKNPPAMWETWEQSLDWEDSLEEGMATHSSILAWRSPMDRGAWWTTKHGISKNQTQLCD